MRKSTFAWLVLIPALLLWSCSDEPALEGPGDQLEAGTLALEEGNLSARVVGDKLEIALPIDGLGEELVKGRAILKLTQLTGTFQAEVSGDFEVSETDPVVRLQLTPVPTWESTGEQANYVLDYDVRLPGGSIHGSRSLFMLLPKADLVVLMPSELVEGQETQARALLSDPRSGAPMPDVAITVTLTDEAGKSRTLDLMTDKFGMALLPLEPAEKGTLTVTAHAELQGSAEEVEADVQVVRDSKVLLTTDKPIYQPGQIIYLRMLALDNFDHHALADKAIVFEVNDSKGNKVFKQSGTTNQFGVASGQFQLGNQVLLGTYTLRAILGDVVTEKTVTVDKYVLPRFKVTAELDRAWYLPGQTVRGDVSASYFFGKAVAGGTVKVIPYKYEAEWVADTEIVGQTTAEGLYSFEYTLPTMLVGQPLEGGKALVMMEIIVTDTADHEEKVEKSIIVAEKAMDLVVIPESGEVVPGVENEFFVFASDPTGEPMAAECTMAVTGEGATADAITVSIPASGPGTVSLYGEPGEMTLALECVPSSGGEVQASFQFNGGDKSAAVLLRTDKSIYKVGESMGVSAYVTGGFGHVFLDLVRKNQTVLTKTLEVEDSVAAWTVDLSNDLAEDLVLNAYLLADNGQFIRDTRVVYVVPANDLSVSVTTDKEEYRPGEKAVVGFEVKDASGAPAQAALGVQVVDEAVFALSENKPGLLKLYFQLEEELSNPTYQVGAGTGWSFGQLFQEEAAAQPGSAEEQSVQDTATAAFAALGEVPLSQKELSSWDDALTQMKSAMGPVYTALKEEVRKQLELALAGDNVDYSAAYEWVKKYMQKPRFYDPWGSAYSYTLTGDQWYWTLTLTTKGPDEEAGTVDDNSFALTVYEFMGQNWRGGGEGWGWMEDDGDFAGPAAGGGGQEPAPEENTNNSGGGDDNGSAAAVKVRKWFPETLFVAPALITDENGQAQVEVPLADSITEWRMSTLASSAAGALGSRTDGIVVFQDFFVDVDFPRFLTRGDEVQFPVVVYNYLTTAQTVDVQLEPAEWFEFLGEDSMTVSLQPGDVKAFYFPVKVTEVGLHGLTVYGIGSSMSDAVQRTVEVRPDGKEVTQAWSARFTNDGQSQSTDHVAQQVDLPEEMIPGSHNIVVQILPGLSSHVVGGMDSMLQLPGGCFEQTTSSAWPNVLAMRYLSMTGQVTPEIEMKAMEYINVGYQRILTFECADGGFNWWEGDNPGNSILSAIAIQMFTDTAEVYPTVDMAVRDRTADYLFATQKSDGSWGEESHLHAGNENLGAGSLRSTCYIAWSLAYGGYGDEAGMTKAYSYISSKLPSETGAYTKAVCLNALILGQPSSSLIAPLLQEFHEAAIVDGDVVYWAAQGDTLVNSYGNAADVELTSLVALAMANKGSYVTDVNGAVEWLIRSKDPQGNWGYNTQATVLALKTFMKALTLTPADVEATVEVLLNGTSIAAKQFNDFNKDVLWQVELTEGLASDANLVEINYSGLGALSYQIVSTYYVPWSGTEQPAGALSIDVDYSADQLYVDETVTCTVTITNNDPESKGMVLVTLGIPPGFALITQDLADLRSAGVISEYEVTGKQLILYFNEIPAGSPTVFSYGLVAEYPVKAETGGSEVSFYYNAEDKDKEASQEIEVLP